MSARGCLALVLVLTLAGSPLAVPPSPQEGAAGTIAITEMPDVGTVGTTADGTPDPEPASVPVNRPIVVAPGDQTQPDLDAPILVWKDERTSPSQVRRLNLSDGSNVVVWPSAYWQVLPSIREGVITFVDRNACYDDCTRIVDTHSGQTWSYTGMVTNSRVAATDEYFVHFGPSYTAMGRHEIDARYISNGTYTHRDGPGRPYDDPIFGGPVASDEWVVLSIRPYDDGYCTPADLDACTTELARFFPADGTIMPFTHSLDLYRLAPEIWKQQCLRDFTAEGNASISGSTIFWQDNRNSDFYFDWAHCNAFRQERWDLYSYNSTSGVETPVLTNPWNETHPDADGNLLVWADDRNGNWDIYAMSLDTGGEIRITDNPADQRNPTVSGGCVVWEDNRNGNWDLYEACLGEPPVIDSVTASPTPALEGSPVTFSVNARGYEGDPLTYAFDFESDGTIDATGPDAVVSHVYGDDFVGNATVSVSDWRTTVRRTVPVVVDNVPPSVVPLSAFRVTASDPGSDDLTFLWAFDDGLTYTVTVYNNGMSPDPYPSPDVNPITATEQVFHLFARPGPHTVMITVRDDDGGATTVQVVVEIPGPVFVP